MFEEKISQFNNQVQPIEPRQEGTERLRNRGTGEDTPPTPLNRGEGPEDIFAETEKIAKAGRVETPRIPIEPRPEALSKKKNWIVLLVIVLLIGLVSLGIAGWFYWNQNKISDFRFKIQKEKEKKEEQILEKEIKEPSVIIPPVMKIDTDNDGLSDEEEKELGANSAKPDTDEDGLFDREEVKVWQTDPLNPDTDRDGHKDGEEVRGGYNPKGLGKWKEVQSLELKVQSKIKN